MNATLKWVLALIAWLVYTVLLFEGCYKDECCKASDDNAAVEDTTPVVPPAEQAKRFALDFKWGDPTTNTNPDWAGVKQGILDQDSTDNILEIVGHYFEGEASPEGYENMGLARAAEIRKLFPNIPNERIRLRAKLVDERDGVRTNYFEAADFNWRSAEKQKETVEDLGDRIVIRFPYNSTQKIYDASVDDYLNKLAERIKGTGEKVTLTGHTDSDGPSDANMNLGRARAREIRDILTSKGVSASQVTIDSKGEEQPVASNNTDAGRQENRRVEVRLLKQN